jgi:hypothetical protein
VFLALWFAAACACPSRGDYARAGLETPERALESFRIYFAAGLHDLEYRCFSTEFKRRNALSLLGYGEARAELERRQPWLGWIARREPGIVESRPGSDGEHFLDLRVGGRTVRVRMVREDFFRIWAADELVGDGLEAFEDLVRFERGPDGLPTLHAQVELGAEIADPRTITRVTVERVWKLDELWELSPSESTP